LAHTDVAAHAGNGPSRADPDFILADGLIEEVPEPVVIVPSVRVKDGDARLCVKHVVTVHLV